MNRRITLKVLTSMAAAILTLLATSAGAWWGNSWGPWGGGPWYGGGYPYYGGYPGWGGYGYPYGGYPGWGGYGYPYYGGYGYGYPYTVQPSATKSSEK